MRPEYYKESYLYTGDRRTVSAELAYRFGVAEAFLLQQISYWTDDARYKKKHSHTKNMYDNFRWVFKTYEDWHEEFKWMSVHTIRKAIYNLERQEIIVSTKKYKLKSTNKTKCYRINYESREIYDPNKGILVDTTYQVGCPVVAVGVIPDSSRGDTRYHASIEITNNRNIINNIPIIKTTTETTKPAFPSENAETISLREIKKISREEKKIKRGEANSMSKTKKVKSSSKSVAEVLQQIEDEKEYKSFEEIVDGFVDLKPSPANLGNLWIEVYRARYPTQRNIPALSGKQRGQLNDIYKKLDSKNHKIKIYAIADVVWEWPRYVAYCVSELSAFGMPTLPDIGKAQKYQAGLINFKDDTKVPYNGSQAVETGTTFKQAKGSVPDRFRNKD